MKALLDIRESLRIALSAMVANKARGVLTTLGIIIGIVAVTTTMTTFNGMQTSFRQGAGAIGVDVLYVSRMPWIIMNDFFLYRNRPEVDFDGRHVEMVADVGFGAAASTEWALAKNSTNRRAGNSSIRAGSMDQIAAPIGTR